MEMCRLSDLSACVFESWSPRIGDPTVMGWITVVGYFAATLASFVAARVRVRDRGFWVFLTLVLLLLGVNKQLDLQSALTAIGRCVAQVQGWYDDRRQVQLLFILGLLVVSGLVMTFAAVRMAPHLKRVGVALFGFGMLVTFVAVRAVGFHHFDTLLGMRVLGARMNWILELGGITLILLNAMFAIRQGRDPVRSPVIRPPSGMPRQ